MDSIYETCLCAELAESGLSFARQRQLPYLRLSRTPLGLLMNFNTVLMKDGIIRVLNPNGSRQRKS